MDDDALYELTHDPALRPDYEIAIHDAHSELRAAYLAGHARRSS